MIRGIKWNELLIKGTNMSISATTRTTLQENLDKYEGFLTHLYLDTKGKVTVGVGHLITNRNAMSGITMYKTQNKKITQAATLQERLTEYDNITKLPWGKSHSAKSFKKHTTLVMKESDIDILLNHHIDNFYKELKNIYKKDKGYFDDFDNFDQKVQLALFDMIFNLGATKLVKSFPTFNTHIKAGDFVKASKESHRLGISDARNNYVEDLLKNIEKEAA